jgi:hypothetical protein
MIFEWWVNVVFCGGRTLAVIPGRLCLASKVGIIVLFQPFTAPVIMPASYFRQLFRPFIRALYRTGQLFRGLNQPSYAWATKKR